MSDALHPYRSHTCNDLRAEHVGSTARLSGWINRRREHAGPLFIDLRDHLWRHPVRSAGKQPAL